MQRAMPIMMTPFMYEGVSRRKARANANMTREPISQLWFKQPLVRENAAQLDMFYSFLARLDARFLPLVFKMEGIIATEGDDYSRYSPESKKVIVEAATTAGSIKAILDTPILTDEGSLTDESMRLTESMGVDFGTN